MRTDTDKRSGGSGKAPPAPVPVQRIPIRTVGRDIYEVSADPRSNRVQHFVARLRVGPDTAMEICAGYRRCHDFDPGNHSGQDFAVVRYNSQFVIGVLADGVSRSFFGNVAATLVSDYLLEELWNLRDAPPDESHIENGLKILQGPVTAELRRIRIDHLPSIQQESLEKARLKGTQTVFAAFTYDVQHRRLTLYRVGDIRTVLYGDEAPLTLENDKKGRWSSAGKSDLLLRREVTENPRGVVLKTDGAPANWGTSLDQMSSERDFQEIAEEGARADDVSFVGFRLIDPALLTTLPEQAPAPAPEARPKTELRGGFWEGDRAANGLDSAEVHASDRRMDRPGQETRAMIRREYGPLGIAMGIGVLLGGTLVYWADHPRKSPPVRLEPDRPDGRRKANPIRNERPAAGEGEGRVQPPLPAKHPPPSQERDTAHRLAVEESPPTAGDGTLPPPPGPEPDVAGAPSTLHRAQLLQITLHDAPRAEGVPPGHVYFNVHPDVNFDEIRLYWADQSQTLKRRQIEEPARGDLVLGLHKNQKAALEVLVLDSGAFQPTKQSSYEIKGGRSYEIDIRRSGGR